MSKELTLQEKLVKKIGDSLTLKGVTKACTEFANEEDVNLTAFLLEGDGEYIKENINVLTITVIASRDNIFSTSVFLDKEWC